MEIALEQETCQHQVIAHANPQYRLLRSLISSVLCPYTRTGAHMLYNMHINILWRKAHICACIRKHALFVLFMLANPVKHLSVSCLEYGDVECR